MYRLEIRLSVVGQMQVDGERTTFHRVISVPERSRIVHEYISAFHPLYDSLLPKDSQPGKPVADPEASTPGAVIFYPGDCNWCKHLVQAYPAKDLRQHVKGSHLHVEGF